MNITQAQELLRSLELRRDRNNDSLEAQLTQLFVPALWGNHIVPTDTLHGRVSQCLNKNRNLIKQRRLIKKVFIEAKETLLRNRNTSTDLSTLVTMINEFHAGKKAPPGKNPSAELESLQNAASSLQESVDAESIENCRGSFLHDVIPNAPPPIDFETFNTLFASETDNEKFFEIYQNYLSLYPEYQHPQMTQLYSLIQQGKMFIQGIQNRFFPSKTPLPDDKRAAELTVAAKEMETILQAIEPGNSWFYCGNYGGKYPALDSIAKLASKVSESELDKLPPEVAKSLKAGKFPDPGAFAAGMIQQGFENFNSILPETDDIIGNGYLNTLLNPLLPNESREISGLFSTILPKSVKTGFESWMQQGLIGNILEFIPDGRDRETILWLTEKAAKLKGSPEERQIALGHLRDKAQAAAQDAAHQKMQFLNQMAEMPMNFLSENVPEMLLDLLGVESQHAAGQFWIKFSKQPDGNYSLLIYASGTAVKSHEKNERNGKVNWPLQLMNIKPEKLNCQFLRQLLFHHVEPRSNQNFSSHPEDLYEGLLNHLQGSINKDFSSEWRHIGAKSRSDSSMTQLMLINPETHPGLPLFELHLEALHSFCKPRLTEETQSLAIQDLSQCTALEKAAQVIEEEMRTLGEVIPSPRIKKIEAALVEVRLAATKFRNEQSSPLIDIPAPSLKLPPQVLASLKTALQSRGISPQTLQSSKSTLCWAFGDEIGDFVDAVVDTLDNVVVAPKKPSTPRIENPPTLPATPKGWVRTIYFNLYFKAIMKGLRFAMLLSAMYHAGTTRLIRTAIGWGLAKIMPKFIQEWFANFVSTVKTKLADFTLHLILQTLLSKEKAAELQGATQNLRSKIHLITKTLTDTHVLDYRLNAPIAKTAAPVLETTPAVPIALPVSPAVPPETNIDAESKIQMNPYASTEHAHGEKISKESLLASLQNWLEISQIYKCNSTALLRLFVVSKIRQLEIPVLGQTGYWDEVENPELLLELFSDLSLNFHSHRKVKMQPDEMIASYFILAIMDRLARRLPEARLDGYRINAYPILILLLDSENTILDPIVMDQFVEVCNYFMPEIDITNLPSPKDIESQAQKTLFDYSKFIFRSGNIITVRISKPTVDPDNPEFPLVNLYWDNEKLFTNPLKETAEYRYLERCFQDPSAQGKFEALGINRNQLNENVKFNILFKESMVFTRGDQALIPRPYTLLRLQNLLCNQSLFDSPSDQALERLPELKSYTPTYHIDGRSAWQLFQEGEYLKFADKTSEKLPTIFHRITIPLHSAFNMCITYFESFSKPWTQSKQISKAQRAPSYFTPYNDIINALEYAPVEPSDKFVRLLAALDQHPTLMTDNEGILLLAEKNGYGGLQTFVLGSDEIKLHIRDAKRTYLDSFFNSASLYGQLQANPKFAETIGEYFKKFLHDLENKNKDNSRIIEFGLYTLKFCKHYAPNHCHTFPDFKKSIETQLSQHPTGSPKNYLYRLLKALSYGENPETLSLEEQQEAALFLCPNLFYFNRATEAGVYSFKIDLGVHYSKWLPTIKTLLQVEAFRNRLIVEVFAALSLQQLANDENTWVQSSNPDNQGYHFECEQVFIDFSSGSIRGDIISTAPQEPAALPVRPSLPIAASIQSDLPPLKRLQKLDGNTLQNNLAPLSRFCSLEEIICLGVPGQQHIEKIVIKSYGLAFKVTDVDGSLLAYSKKFPGYFLAAKQGHPLLEKFSSYLTLTNHTKEHKVLLPASQWLESIVSCYIESLGPLVPYVNQWLRKIQKSAAETTGHQKYYVYELDSLQGLLTSDDPEALGYLLSLYILQGNQNGALKTCESLERLCKYRHVSEDILNVLYPLFIPCGIDGIAHVRQRIFSALEENRLLQIHSSKSKTNSLSSPVETLNLTTGLILFDMLQNTQETNPQRKLTVHQEWFLYKKLFRNIRQLIERKLDPRIESMIKTIGWDAVIELFLPPRLTERLVTLQEQVGIKSTLAHRTLRFTRKLLIEESTAASSSAGSSAASSSDQTPLLLVSGPNLINEIKNFFLKKNSQRIYHEQLSDLEGLAKVMSHVIVEDPPLTLETITAEALRSHFLSYYAIVRDQNDAEKVTQFRELLPLIKSGWDSQSRYLLMCLGAALSKRILFPATGKLQEILGIIDEKEKKTRMEKFFSEVKNSHFFSEIVYNQVSSLGRAVGHEILERGLSYLSPQRPSMEMAISSSLSHLITGCKIAKKAYNIYTAPASSASLPPNLSLPREEPELFFLAIEDAKIDRIFDALFFEAFEEVNLAGQGTAARAISLFPALGESPAEIQGTSRINGSIDAYYAREDLTRPLIRLRSEKSLRELYLKLIFERDALKATIEQEREQILSHANSINCKSKKSWRVKFDDLQRFFLKGNVKEFAELSNIPPNLFSAFEKVVARDTVRATRLQQLERAARTIEEISSLNSETSRPAFNQKVEQLICQLEARRAYNFETVPSKLLRRFMIFELLTDKMLWKKQVSCMETLLLGEQGDAVIELLMSFGKTYFGIPTINSFHADGQKVVFNIWPSSLFGSNMQQISEQSKRVYDQTANALHFSRSFHYTVENFEAIAVALHRAKLNGETINMTKEDAQALELIFLDRLYRISQGTIAMRSDEETMIAQIATILRTMRHSSMAIGDEAHELFNNKQELRYPIGEAKTLSSAHYGTIEECMKHIAVHPKFSELFDANETRQIMPVFKSEIVPFLAEKMSRYYKFEISTEEHTAEFISYVSGKAAAIPAWISASPHFKQITVVKGLLEVLLKDVFEHKVNVDFGPSEQANGEFARPYEGNSSPQEKSTLSDPYEAVVKTAVMLLHRKLTQEQVEVALSTLETKAVKEMKTRGVAKDQTLAYQFINRCRAHSNGELKNNPSFILFYLRHFVLKQIKYWENSLKSDVHNFKSMFSSGNFDTGSPFNDGEYPHGLEMIWDPGTIGEALHLLKKKCPADNGIHLLESSGPKAILNEILHTYFRAGSDFTALIEGAADLHGMDNLTVAKQMIEFITKDNCRPDIQAVDFYMRDADGLDQLMTLQVGSETPIPYHHCHLPVEARFAYFDQRHGFGANIPQKYNGKALLLLGENHMLYKLMQEAFRMRGIKDFKRFIEGNMTLQQLEEQNLTQTQSIHIAMTSAVKRKIISEDRIPTLEEIVSFTAKNQASMISKNNYESYQKKIPNITRRAILDKILDQTSVSGMVNLFAKGREFLVTTFIDDPIKRFGQITTTVPTETALEHSRVSFQGLRDKTGIFNAEEKAALVTEVSHIAIPPMPPATTVSIDGSNRLSNLISDLGQSLTHENDVELEVEQEQELETELRVQNNDKEITPFKEWGWKSEFDPYSRNWIHFQATSTNSSLLISRSVSRIGRFFTSRVRFDKSIPPLFRVTDLLNNAQTSVLRRVSEAFDARLWMTNNFLPRIVRKFSEEPAEIGGSQQRELFQVLMHLDGDDKIQSVGCLSQRDAAKWRVKLGTREHALAQSTEEKVVLYDTQLRDVVAGSDVDIRAFRSKPDLLTLETQLQFLNGNENYPSHVEPLRDWMEKKGFAQLKEAFMAIHAQRGQKPLLGTDFEQVCATLSGVLLEDQL